MSNGRGWSVYDRLGSAAGLLVIAAIFSVVAWWLGTATAAAKADSDRLLGSRPTQGGLVYGTRRDGGARSSMAFLGAGTCLTGGIALVSVIGAVWVLVMPGPRPEE